MTRIKGSIQMSLEGYQIWDIPEKVWKAYSNRKSIKNNKDVDNGVSISWRSMEKVLIINSNNITLWSS